jgi:hypothetical protein
MVTTAAPFVSLAVLYGWSVATRVLAAGRVPTGAVFTAAGERQNDE